MAVMHETLLTASWHSSLQGIVLLASWRMVQFWRRHQDCDVAARRIVHPDHGGYGQLLRTPGNRDTQENIFGRVTEVFFPFKKEVNTRETLGSLECLWYWFYGVWT